MATRFQKTNPFAINAAKGKYSISSAVAITKIEIAIGKENSEILRPMKQAVNMVTYSVLPVVRQWNEEVSKSTHQMPVLTGP